MITWYWWLCVAYLCMGIHIGGNSHRTMVRLADQRAYEKTIMFRTQMALATGFIALVWPLYVIRALRRRKS
jgi:uncharacterized membrane protein AbrB (regulator of aidB expression)